MNKDKQNLLEARKHQLANMSEMVDELRDENESLKRDNFLLSEVRKKLLVEEETLNMRLNSVLK